MESSEEVLFQKKTNTWFNTPLEGFIWCSATDLGCSIVSDWEDDKAGAAAGRLGLLHS